MNTSQLVKSKRVELGLTQKEFSDALGLGKYGDRTLRRWENGESHPSNIEMQAILKFANKTPLHTNSSDNYLFTFIDLFAGIGGIRIPFQQNGGKCVFTSEWDKFAQKTYRINFGDTPAGDISEISSESIPDFEILLAGFPCQPFSQAGLKKGFSDIRGTLFFEIERIIEAKRPKAFLLENVKQLKGHDRGRTLKVITERLNNLNYTIDYDVLRAADFGVPQNRERIFIVGFDKDFFPIEEDFKFKFPCPSKPATKVGDILEDHVDEKYTISDRLYEGHLRRKQQHKAKGNGFGFSLFDASSPYTNTLSARYYKDGSEILISQGDNKKPRKLTPRECARLQGFPEDFIIPVSNTQAYKQFGNSVAIPVVKAVSDSMIEQLIDFSYINKQQYSQKLEVSI